MPHVAVLGAGVVGIHMARVLRSHGHTVSVFESQSRIGGTWTNQGDATRLKLQVASRHYRYPSFNHARDIDCADAAYVQQYVEEYAREFEIYPLIKFETQINRATRVGQAYTLHTDKEDYGPYDYVVQTGQTTDPVIPPVYEDALANGAATHSSTMTQAWLDAAEGEQVVVVGGSKSASDAVEQLVERGAKVTWLARRYVTYGHYTPTTTLSIVDVLRAIPKILLQMSPKSIILNTPAS